MATKRKKFRIRQKPEKPDRQKVKASLIGALNLNTSFQKEWGTLQARLGKDKDVHKYNKDLSALYSKHLGTSDKKIINFFSIYNVIEDIDNMSLSEVISVFSEIQQILKKWGIEKTEIGVNYGEGCCCHSEGPSLNIHVWCDESEESYENRLQRYKTSLKRYNTWYENNKEKIKEELALREQEN